MSDEKKMTTVQDSAEQAKRLEAEIGAKPDTSIYTHTFQKPFTYQSTTYKELTFDWGSLSGRDSIAINREVRNQGVTTITAALTPEYLAAMAARACTYRNEDGFRTVTIDMLYDLPLREFQSICNAAQRFLLWLESKRATADAGSESNV